jgi:hypothetical protein
MSAAEPTEIAECMAYLKKQQLLIQKRIELLKERQNSNPDYWTRWFLLSAYDRWEENIHQQGFLEGFLDDPWNVDEVDPDCILIDERRVGEIFKELGYEGETDYL